jgi:hypothetical protein
MVSPMKLKIDPTRIRNGVERERDTIGFFVFPLDSRGVLVFSSKNDLHISRMGIIIHRWGCYRRNKLCRR